MVPSARLKTAAVLAAIMAFGLLLRVRAADHPYISQWDEAYHALVAKNLTRHPLEPTLYEAGPIPSDERDWQRAHVWLHKPPLPLWLMASSIAAFGRGELAFRLPSVLLDTLAVLLVFLLAVELFGADGPLAGLFAAALYAVNPLMIRLVSGRVPDDHAHLINAFFVTLTAWLFVAAARRGGRARAAAAGAALGLGTLCMSVIALLGLAAPLPLFAVRRDRRATLALLGVSLAAFAVVALPWPLYALIRWPLEARLESSLQFRHLFVALDGHAHGAGWFLGLLPVQYGGFAFSAAVLAVAALAFTAFRAVRDRNADFAVPLLWAVLPYSFFSLIQTKLYAYTCVAVPALGLMIGALGAAAWRVAARRSRKEFPRRAAAAAVLLVLGFQIAATAAQRWISDTRLSPWNGLYDYPALRAAALEIGRTPGPRIVFNVGDDKSPQVMYYADCAAYPFAPSVAGLRYLLARGYRVYFFLDEGGDAEGPLSGYRAAGLLGRLTLVRLPKPSETVRVHPYES